MREQLGHLLEATARPRVTLQVIPFEVGQRTRTGRTHIRSSPSRERPMWGVHGDAENAQLLTDPARVDPLSAQFDALRSWALPQAASAACFYREKELSHGSDRCPVAQEQP